MMSTGVISASDYPFFGRDRQHFDEKPLLESGKRSFATRISCLACSMGSEISTFSNDTAGGLRKSWPGVVYWGCRTSIPENRHRFCPDGRWMWLVLKNAVLFREKKCERR